MIAALACVQVLDGLSTRQSTLCEVHRRWLLFGSIWNGLMNWPQPVLLMRGTQSPPWAAEVVGVLAGALADVEVVVLPGAGHEGVDTAADEVAGHLVRFFEAP